jgi:dipeptidyl aminopeptidase/acylaminoacyl peptidase
MPSDKKTAPERPRRTGPGTSQRPASPTARPGLSGSSRSNTPLSQPPGKGPARREKSFSFSWKAIWENIGWGLVIGLPVILVILAILWRATDGFTATPNANAPLPTPVPTVTAGVYVAPPAASGNKDRLLYLQSPTLDTPMQLYSSNLDGSNPFQLTNSTQNKASPVWSPDGKQIAFTADNAGIQMVNFDGTGLHTVAYNGYSPVWSPDGKQIAFIKNLPAPDGVGPDGIGIIRALFVTNANAKPGDERQVASDALGHNWSPDSKQIAFFSLRNAVMFTVDVATAQSTQIKLPDKLGGWYPTFSPDGNSLVFYGDPNPAVMVNALDLAVAANSSTAVEGDLTPTAVAATTVPATTAAATTTANATAGTTPGATPSTGATAAAITGTPAATVAPTATPIPGPPSQISLYMINRDGSNLKKLQDLEPVGGGGKFRFNYYIATSVDVVSVLSSRPSYKVGPVFSPDGKSVSALYVAQGDKVGLAVVRLDGSPATLVVEGQNNLPAGIRLSPAFTADGSRLLYTFTPPTPPATGATPTPGVSSTLANQPLKEGRYFDLATKTEKSVFTAKADTTFQNCCGLGK